MIARFVGILAVIVLLAALALVVGGRGDGGAEAGAPPPAIAARAAAVRFLDGYVDADGRVVRRDQGGDTVSEGQAYGLMIAVAVDDRERFARIWAWTDRNLRRDDGLLASRWNGGRVVDPEPATDADLDAARALLLAAERFGERAYRRAGLSMARGILAREVVADGARVLLVAGPWARREAVVNPSYFAPRAYQALGDASRDGRWSDLAVSSRALLTSLTAPERLPPDWASIDSAGEVRPAGPPSTPDDLPRYGFDAIRTPIRLAESCEPADRDLAGRLWPLLQRAGEGRAAVELTLDGDALALGRHATAIAAAAAAALAAGMPADAQALLHAAEAQDRREPTYYGSAWVAIARLTLDTDLLGACP